jgi:ABC-type Zn uptake system ZnuABC Zn-binding protein ZnuA
MRLLQQADLVIWIDRNFEAGFQQVAQILPTATLRLELMPELGIDSDDGHIWYSTALLLQAIKLISARLAAIDPDKQTLYRANAADLSAAITAWRADSIASLQDRQPRFITDHAFLSHMQDDLGYAAITNIHDQHDAHAGLRELNRIEQRLRQQPARCLLTLESTPPPLALELAQKYSLKVISLEPTNSADRQAPAFIRRLQRLTAALLECS